MSDMNTSRDTEIMLDGRSRKQHCDMILAPFKWPHLYLPLKRRDPNTGLCWQVALLRSAISAKAYNRAVELGEPVEFLVDVNQTMFGVPIGEVERVVYATPDEILDAGWIVD